jgi:anti-sigma factor RsiW
MEPTEEMMNAFVDGELPADEMRAVETLIATRPDLKAYVERQHKLRSTLVSAFAPAMDEAIPQRLRDAAMFAPASSGFRAKSWLRAFGETVTGANFLLRSAAPAAAALACGLIVGVAIQPGAPSDFRATSAGQMIAQGELADALTNRLASAGAPASGPRIGVSFRNRNGEDCRTFSVPGANASTAGIACRTGDAWAVAALITAPRQSQNAYQQAGSEMPPVIRETVSSMIVGEAFDAAAERAARDRGWKPN